MYVECFTQTDSWNEWQGKEGLAIGIKEIVERNVSFKNKSSIYVEKMIIIYMVTMTILKYYSYVV